MKHIQERISHLIESIAVHTSHNECDPFAVNVMHRTVCDLIAFYDQFWDIPLESEYSRVISSCSSLAESLVCTAVMLRYQKHFDAAASVLNAAIDMAPASIHYVTLLADILREKGDRAAARSICDRVRQTNPEFSETQLVVSHCDMNEQLGDFVEYYRLLSIAHDLLKPDVYVEIGVSNGKSMALAREKTVAIGIDPLTAEFDHLVFVSPENSPKLFKMTSDDFFSSVDIPTVMEHRFFEMAFIDGLHVFEQVLRDFINLEKYAGPDSVVFIHDCLPANHQMAERVRQSAFWVGDVWKIIPCLKDLRPDLEIVTFPAHPSGLAVIRNLNPLSHVLERHFDNIVSCYMDKQLPLEQDILFTLLNVHPEPSIDSFRRAIM